MCRRNIQKYPTLKKLGTFFGHLKKAKKIESGKQKKIEKNDFFLGNDFITGDLTKNQGLPNEDSSQTTDDAVGLPECSKTPKVATMPASTDESSENFQPIAETDQSTKPFLSATELLNWLCASDYGRATEKHGVRSFEVLHECSCWIVFVAKGQKSFLFRKMKNQSFTDDHDERLCNAELKFGKGISRAYRLRNCQGTMSRVGVPLSNEIDKNWKKMVKNVNIQGEIKELNNFGTLFINIQSKRSKKKEKRKANQNRHENNSTTN